MSYGGQAHGMQLHQHQIADRVFRQIGVLAQREGDVFKDGEVGK